MGLARNLYFMALVGALAGLMCWSLAVWAPEALSFPQELFWLIDLIHLTLLGALIGGLTVGFSDHWAGEKVLLRWLAAGTAMGLLFGALAALLAALLPRFWTTTSGWGERVLGWALAGSLIGLGIGLRWSNVNKRRALHAWLGGGAGGFLGGVLFASMGSRAADFFQAAGFIFTGMGISCGVAAAPVLMRQGTLHFIESDDPRTQKKYAAQRKTWELQKGDRYVLGSLGADKTATLYSQEVQVFLPDEAVAPRHAILTGRGGRFYLERHPESLDPQGFFQFTLQVRGRDLDRAEALQAGDEILIGSTRLRFQSH
ncbi:MAG: FHA domain-containing protein [Acidobacteria bacterium]|nr:FHA domain-containing protein [Acidobacteriota bacterium]MCI0621157.1 FHA domain-containing protein [Acidobacteriota bacterium]MCI0722553.1 FHA domain-containing protein [Acidobacteriota bacterium]